MFIASSLQPWSFDTKITLEKNCKRNEEWILIGRFKF